MIYIGEKKKKNRRRRFFFLKGRIGEVGVGGLGADFRIFLGGRARIGVGGKREEER